MALSYTSLSSGGAASNDFTINIGSTGYTNVTLSTEFPAGNYIVTSSLSDATLDIYLQAEDGTSAGYVNAAAATSSLTATKSFKTVIVYGSTNNDTLTFQFKYVFSPSSATTNYAAAPRLISNTPTALVNQNSTTTITGQNFSTGVEIYFIGSDNVERPAKTIVRNSSTELVVTRPDTFPPAYSPYTIKAVNPGIADPTSTNSHKLSNSVTAGAVPSWVTTSPLPQAYTDTAYTTTLSATDSDGSNTYTITTGSLPSGYSLNSSTGVISGTSSSQSNASFTVRATDSGGNYTDRAFLLPLQAVPSQPISPTATGYDGFAYVSWTTPSIAGTTAISGYRITSSPGSIIKDVGVTNSGTINGLSNGTTYTFEVKALNTYGYSAGSTTNAVVPVAGSLRSTLNASGTYNLPAGFGGNNTPLYATVYAIGGGGGGGGGQSGNYYGSSQPGGGGGGSGYVSSGLITLTGAIGYTVGGAGTGGNVDAAGNAGGASNFSNLSGAGGQPGQRGAVRTGGAGGSGGGSGGNGGSAGSSGGSTGGSGGGSVPGSGSGNTLSPGGGGGGGGWTSGGAGGNASNIAGAGAAGDGNPGKNANASGIGGGGGGGYGGGYYSGAGDASPGGDGANGAILIYY